MKSNVRRTFTLVEIPVVLAIIAVLVTLLMPVFARVRGQGEKTACASSLRQPGDRMHPYLIAYLDGHIKWMSADAQGQRDEACEPERP